MPTTTNFGWTTPADTDLVKDGASAIRTLGNGIDTSLVDLKGGTTGQVLSKASNTDLDFTWVAQDDSNAIQNAIVDAKGDLITATAADTPARLAVGADGTYLQADSTTSTGLKWGTISAGGMTLISTTTLSGSSTTISSIPTTYKHLYLVLWNGSHSTNSRQALNMAFNTVSDLQRIAVVNGNAGFVDGTSGSSGSPGVFGYLTTAGNNFAEWVLPRYSETSGFVYCNGRGALGTTLFMSEGFGSKSAATTSITFSVSSGTMAGTIYTYGVS